MRFQLVFIHGNVLIVLLRLENLGRVEVEVLKFVFVLFISGYLTVIRMAFWRQFKGGHHLSVDLHALQPATLVSDLISLLIF